MEQWKDITRYEGLYQVSNLGNVRSLVRNKKTSDPTQWRSLKLIERKRDGYIEVSLSKNNVSVRRKVHRLVAEAFVDNPMNLAEVNHKDENRSNNRADNLEWCTHKYNIDYGTRNKRIAKSISKPVCQMLDGVVVKRWNSISEATQFGFDSGRISDCCNGKAKHHKGYEWQFS